MLRTSAAFLACIASAPAAAAGWPDLRTPGTVEIFRDWVIGCDSRLVCMAMGLSEETAGNGPYLTVRRDIAQPHPQVQLHLSYTTRSPMTPSRAEDAEPFDVVVRIFASGRQRYHDKWTAKVVAGTEGKEHFVASPPDDGVQVVLAALIEGDNLVLHDDLSLGVSLAGSAAALLRLDDRQGLVDTPTASSHVGDGPAEPWRDWPAQQGEGVGAHAFFDPDPDSPRPATLPSGEDPGCEAVDPIVAIMQDGTTFWGICNVHGNTNTIYSFWLEKNGNLSRAVFPAPTPGAPPAAELANPWIGEGSLLWSFEAARGLGDCGARLAYGWEPGSGFVLAHVAEMPLCRGVPYFDWPVLLDIIDWGEDYDETQQLGLATGNWGSGEVPALWQAQDLTAEALCAAAPAEGGLTEVCSDPESRELLERALAAQASAAALALDSDSVAEDRTRMLLQLADGSPVEQVLGNALAGAAAAQAGLLGAEGLLYRRAELEQTCVPLAQWLLRDLPCTVASTVQLGDATAPDGTEAFLLQTSVDADTRGGGVRGYVVLARAEVIEPLYRPVFAEVQYARIEEPALVLSPYGPAIQGQASQGRVLFLNNGAPRLLTTDPLYRELEARFPDDHVDDLWVDYVTMEGEAYLRPREPLMGEDGGSVTFSVALDDSGLVLIPHN